MTCIVGIAEQGKVYIGGDSITSNGWNRQITARRKVFRIEDLLIGTCGSIRANNLISQVLTIRAIEEHENIEHYLIEGVVEPIRSLLKERGVSKVDNNVESGEVFLVGYRGQLFKAHTDFQVDTYVSGIAACGVAEEFALGAMLALSEMSPEARIRRALEVASECCALVAPPFFVKTLE